MSGKETEARWVTHEVFNQSPPLEDVNLFTGDRALRAAVTNAGGDWADNRLAEYGALAGGELMALGAAANKHVPELKTHDRFGNRIDEVEYHPSYHRLMEAGVKHGLHALPWQEPRDGAHVARAALFYMHAQAEAGTLCPLTMTFAVVPALRADPNIAAEWMPRLLSGDYDPTARPVTEKRGATMGMAMTEKQGGSDVRANTTRARPLGKGGPGAAYELVGHKWFCSAPMSDAFLTLAQTENGLSCFLLPRWRPDGVRNDFHIQRLKDKLGNRSNASAEIEYRGAYAVMLGPEGRGVRTIIEMVHHTRLDCTVGSAGLMRQAVAQALHHARHREAFGKRLADQPLMQNVLADLAVESEAALVMAMRLAQAFDKSGQDAQERLFARVGTAVGKYWSCKRAPALIYEAMECLGGNGYVEESILPRLYREAPVNAIWEGSGNVIALDVLRAFAREPESRDAFIAELERGRGGDARYDAYLDVLAAELGDSQELEYRARRVVEAMAKALQARLLMDGGDADVAEAFLASRLAGGDGEEYGTLPRGLAVGRIIERATPA